jgi:hypothetical protein
MLHTKFHFIWLRRFRGDDYNVKSKQMTDDGRRAPSDGKSSHCLCSLLFLLNDAFLAEKQQMPILYSFVWPDRVSYPQSIALETVLTITLPMRFPIFILLLLIFFNQFFFIVLQYIIWKQKLIQNNKNYLISI